MNGYKEEILRGYLAHGSEWRRHKYIRKEGNKYIYPDTLGGHIDKRLEDHKEKKQTKIKDRLFQYGNVADAIVGEKGFSQKINDAVHFRKTIGTDDYLEGDPKAKKDPKQDPYSFGDMYIKGNRVSGKLRRSKKAKDEYQEKALEYSKKENKRRSEEERTRKHRKRIKAAASK